MKKIIQFGVMISLAFLIGCASTAKEEIDVRPLPPQEDIPYEPMREPMPEPMPMPEPIPEPVTDAAPEDFHDTVHIPTDEELNIDPSADSYEQVKFNEEVEYVSRPARQTYTPEIDHIQGQEIFVELHVKHFNDRDELNGVRGAILAGAHGNYKIQELKAPNLKSKYFKLQSALSSINLYETLSNLFENEGYDVNLEKRSDKLFVVTSNSY